MAQETLRGGEYWVPVLDALEAPGSMWEDRPFSRLLAILIANNVFSSDLAIYVFVRIGY